MLTQSGLVVLLAKATIILVVALGITRLMQRASAGARHLVWLATLGALLLIPAVTTWAPLRVAVLPSVASGTPAQPVAAAVARQVADAVVPAAVVTPQAVARTPIARWAIRGVELAVAIWAAVVLLILGSFAWSGLAVRRIVRHARTLDGPTWVTPLVEVADRMGLDATPGLLVSSHTKMPFACGVFRATIVLPDECEGWSLDRRHAVLLHELAHVRRKDLLGHMLGRLVCAAYWFHPLVWMAATRLRSESERACDDLALSCGTRATDYAEHLLEIVTSVRRDTTPTVALAMARRKEFEGRMLAILDPELRHSSPSRRQSAALIGSLAVLAGVVAAIAPVARLARASPVQEATGAVASRPAATTTATPTMPSPVAVATPRPKPTPMPTATPAPAAAPARAPVRAPLPGGAKDDERAALLAKVLRSDSSASLRRIAAWGLQEYADQAVAVDALVYAVRHDADASVREMSAWSLGETGDNAEGATEALGAALHSDADARVRGTAAWALGTSGANGAQQALTAGLTDADADVRSQAVWALGTIGIEQAPPGLTAFLKDKDDKTRLLTAWALYQIHDPATLPALEAALHTESDPDIQIAYIRAIAEMGDQSVSTLSGLLTSSDPGVKAMAVRALAGGHATGPWPWPWPRPRPSP
jgi:beta-lactamase regulating signal transducer with metallopeptidase domain